MTNSSFQPLWVSPPGDTINDIIKNKGLTDNQLADLLGLTVSKVEKLLSGKTAITSSLAEKLENTLGSTATYWLSRESQYREDLIRLEPERNELKKWIKKIPVSDMIKSGWIDKNKDRETSCLQFFGITKASEWYERYNDMLAITAFKTSTSFDSEPESVVTWLRKGEISSKQLETDLWDPSKFRNAIIEARKLSRIKDPEDFIPKLQSLFSPCGVALIVEKTPTRCRASGAAYFTSPTQAILLLSGRYLSDDHFWFCLFHEAGHLLLHGNKQLFLEFDDKSKYVDIDKDIKENEEDEADHFAEKALIPNEFKDELMALNAKKWKDILRFAKTIGISSGIVVGQLQHLGIINHNQLNKLKNKYKWSDGKLIKT